MDDFRIKTVAKVTKQGNSLVLMLTKDLRKMGLDEGNWVEVTLQYASVDYKPPISEKRKHEEKYDPSRVGNMIIKSLETCLLSMTDDEIRKLAETYDGNEDHIEQILAYVKGASKNNLV